MLQDSGPALIDEGGKDRDDAEIKTVGKTMDFTFIKPQDAGTYICTAINVVGNATKTVKFDVRCKMPFTLSTYCLLCLQMYVIVSYLLWFCAA